MLLQTQVYTGLQANRMPIIPYLRSKNRGCYGMSEGRLHAYCPAFTQLVIHTQTGDYGKIEPRRPGKRTNNPLRSSIAVFIQADRLRRPEDIALESARNIPIQAAGPESVIRLQRELQIIFAECKRSVIGQIRIRRTGNYLHTDHVDAFACIIQAGFKCQIHAFPVEHSHTCRKPYPRSFHAVPEIHLAFIPRD